MPYESYHLALLKTQVRVSRVRGQGVKDKRVKGKGQKKG